MNYSRRDLENPVPVTKTNRQKVTCENMGENLHFKSTHVSLTENKILNIRFNLFNTKRSENIHYIM